MKLLPVVNMAIKDFLSGKYDKVFVAYTDFVSVVKQIPRIKQLCRLILIQVMNI